MELLDLKIRVALAKWLQIHYFDTEYTVIKSIDDQHAKDGVSGKNW